MEQVALIGYHDKLALINEADLFGRFIVAFDLAEGPLLIEVG